MNEQLLVDIDKNIIVSEYELILCKPNKEEICIINANNIVYTAEFANIDELEFEVPSYIIDEHKKIKNPIFDLIKGDYLIKFDNYKFFIITNVIKESTEDGNEYKKISCLSKEYELANKQIVEYRANSRKLYDISNSKDEDGIEWGILNYIERLTSWKVDYIKTELMNRRRSFDITRQNLIQTFKDIQLSYGCLFQFDTENKLINIYEVTDLGIDRGLYISDDNYIKSITENIKHDEIKTRLYLYGKDNISINKLNPTGSFYLENFEFYKTTEYMDQSLIDALDDYQILVQSKKGEFEDYLDELNTLNEQLITKENELFVLETELEIINDNIDTKIKNEEDYEDLNVQKETKQLEIDVKNTEIDGLNSQITVVGDNISNLRNIIKSENNFTSEQLGELDYFIKEETYQDSNYTEENIDELYERGQEILAKISQPPIEFDIDVVDFLSIVECQHDWDKLVLGDIVTIRHESLGVNIQVRLIGYTHDVDSNSLTLKFSNKNSIDDPNIYLKDLLSRMSSTSTHVDFSRFKWDQYDDDKKSDILLYVDSELDAARNKILAGKNQDVVIGDRGIICGDKNNPNEEVRILNNIIAFTNNGWKTANLALTPKGIVAEHVVGKLGVFATVQANQIEVGDSGELIPKELVDGLEYIDEEIEELNTSLGDLATEIDDAFSDGKVTNIEANGLKIALNNLMSESTDLVDVAVDLGITTEKNVYSNAITTLESYLKNNWIDKTSYPISITTYQRNNIVNYFKNVEDKKSKLINKITLVREQRAKDYLDNNALKQNFNYNNTRITVQDGVAVYDNYGDMVLQMGGMDTDGNGYKDAYGFKAIHNDGSQTIVDGDGFKRVITSNGNVYSYISLDHAGSGVTDGSYKWYADEDSGETKPPSDEEVDSMGVGVAWITIPNPDFNGRNFKVIPSFTGFDRSYIGGGGSTSYEDTMVIDVQVLEYDHYNARFKIRARKALHTIYRGSWDYSSFDGCYFSYYAYAIT